MLIDIKNKTVNTTLQKTSFIVVAHEWYLKYDCEFLDPFFFVIVHKNEEMRYEIFQRPTYVLSLYSPFIFITKWPYFFNLLLYAVIVNSILLFRLTMSGHVYELTAHSTFLLP